MTRDDVTVFCTRAVPGGRIGRLVLAMWLSGMAGMMVGLLLTFGNIFGGMVGLVLPMLWFGRRMTKRARYAVSPAGVREVWLDAKGEPT
ncbi:MAG: hypothetical protein IPM13_18210, partial [Phycisphaerales bacterium]|nr:hypothetical protein [Phycisphaerales bacterium]